MRLFDFSMAYLDGKMKIVGPIARVIQIFDALNRATDRPQSVGEYLRLGLFRIGKALFPNKVLTFESIDHYAQNASAYKFVLG